MKYHLNNLTKENFKRPFIYHKQNNIVKPKLIFSVTKYTVGELSWIFERDEFPIIYAFFVSEVLNPFNFLLDHNVNLSAC